MGTRHRFVAAKARANTVKALVTTDAEDRLLLCEHTRVGSTHEVTQVRRVGLVELLALMLAVTLFALPGYQGPRSQAAGAVLTP